jgi:hypothetical protein
MEHWQALQGLFLDSIPSCCEKAPRGSAGAGRDTKWVSPQGFGTSTVEGRSDRLFLHF